MHLWTPEIQLAMEPVGLTPEQHKELAEAHDEATEAHRAAASAAAYHRDCLDRYRTLLARSGVSAARLFGLGFPPPTGLVWRPVPASAPMNRPGAG